MPMGNGMGPNGQGPRTGRGAGFCNGFNTPGAYNRGGLGMGGGRGLGFGGGFGRGAGRGIGYAGGYNAGYAGYNAGGIGFNQPVGSADYNDMLREEADILEKRISAIKDQLNKVEKDSE